MNLNFVILYVGDVAKAATFYKNALGMQVIEEMSGPNFVALRSEGGAMVGLQDKAASKLPPAHEPTGSVELSFEDANIDETWKRWQEMGVELVAEPMDLPFGRYCLAKDSEGHYLSLYRFNRQAAPQPESAHQAS